MTLRSMREIAPPARWTAVAMTLGLAAMLHADPCEVPDDGSGTVVLPPEGCAYLSPDEFHMIVDGLPPGTTIEIKPIHHRFICKQGPQELCNMPGGTLGGEREVFFSEALFQMRGTGDLQGFQRLIAIPLMCIADTGPRDIGAPVQTFPNEMFQLSGGLFGDPDFDQLQVVGGLNAGMPSPGQTTLSNQGPTWVVDSFFDITYRIDFTGAPGGALDGMSGSTTGTVHMEAQGPAPANRVQVIYSEKDGHPSSVVPGARDLDGQPAFTEFKAMEDFSLSPDGSQWALKGRNELGSDLETQVHVGSGLTGDMFMQEGQPFLGAGKGLLYDFFDTTPGPVSWNENGVMGFSARSKGGPTATDEKIVIFDGTHMVVLQEGDPVGGLVDNPPSASGDEILGSSLGPVLMRNDGSIAYVSNPIGNCHSTRYPALFIDATGEVQSGVDTVEGETWDTLGLNDWWGTPDGQSFLIEGETEEAASDSDRILAIHGGFDAIVVREGSPVGGSPVICADIFFSNMVANGLWVARGDDPSDNDWAVSGNAKATGPAPPTVLAVTGDPIDESGSGETWGDVFLAVNINTGGHWVLAGNTSNPDPAIDSVIVLNGQRVVVREGDPVDLDGNGFFDDDAFIGRGDNTLSAFAANDIALTPDMKLYFIAPLRNAAGEDLGTFGAGGEAFMALDVSCPADIAGPDGESSDGNVDSLDFLALLAQWGSPGNCPPGPPCSGDITGPGGTPDGNVDSLDFLALIAQWGSPGNCPPMP